MLKRKKVELVTILNLIKEGKTPSKISKEFSIPKGTLAYHVDKLKKLGCIERKGYGVWSYLKPIPEVRLRPKGSMTGDKSNILIKEIRGHAFIWKIEFTQPYNWAKVLQHYKKKNLKFNLICNEKVPRTIFNNRKIWLTKRGLVIYEPIDFMGKSSFEVKGRAIFQMDLLIKNLLKELNVKFRTYRFTTSREHYGMVKNELARQYNDKKEKMHIHSVDGDIWLWIDDSKGLGELETNKPDISRQVQNYWNNQKKHKFKIDADFILNGFAKVNENAQTNASNMQEYGEQVTTHVKLMKKIDKNLSKQTKFFKEMSNYFKTKL